MRVRRRLASSLDRLYIVERVSYSVREEGWIRYRTAMDWW
jgi:hypothetical protein